MDRHTPARWLAPLALLLTVGAVWVVVSSGSGESSVDGDPAGSGITASQTTEEPASTTTTTTPVGDGPRFYRVRPGDTLTAISDATGVPLDQIEELNDNIDSQSLTVGQRIRLRP